MKSIYRYRIYRLLCCALAFMASSACIPSSNSTAGLKLNGLVMQVTINVPGDFTRKTLRLVTYNAAVDPTSYTSDPTTGVPYGPNILRNMKSCASGKFLNVDIGDAKSVTFSAPKAPTKIILYAYIDLNGNGILDQNEPYGVDPNNPIPESDTYSGSISISRLYPSNHFEQ